MLLFRLRNCLKLPDPNAESLSSRQSDWQSKKPDGLVYNVQSTTRNDKLVSVCRTQTKPISELTKARLHYIVL